MDATKDASGRASLDHSRRASTSISVARQSVDFLLSTSTSTSTTTTASSSNPNVARSLPSRSSPPPSYLLDDDPFANLTPMTVGTRHRASSSVASTSSGIPRRHRPPPIHPELVPGLSLPAVPVGLQTPKSRLQETIDTLADSEGDKLKRVRSQDGDQEMKEKKEESKRKRPKTFFVTMSAPVSPSKAFFASKVPVPPLPSTLFFPVFHLYFDGVLTSLQLILVFLYPQVPNHHPWVLHKPQQPGHSLRPGCSLVQHTSDPHLLLDLVCLHWIP